MKRKQMQKEILRVAKFLVLIFIISASKTFSQANEKAKHIVNIVNFIRELEPRDSAITKDVLYQTVVSQINLFSHYHLPATYLLQYDALIDPRYQTLLKERIIHGDEVGAWWEITQPHVEAAGIKWRGRYPWDWHADVGFSTGYTQKEREILVDVYMKKFKEVFGKYPASVASWFIDEHSLAYMYDKYHIVASANCKDQIGTDGYTLWGGYWNQAYYPSRLNAYMPAQTKEGQIAVPIFRMLGSDPIYQYENGLGSNAQGVITMEPVYGAAGSNRDWVNWFMKTLTDQPCLAFAYTQVGQENSFTWKEMQHGLEMQAPIFDSLRKAGKINVETLSASGKWFKEKFALTPATSVAAMNDYKNDGKKTVWYNSRFYRANILWKNDSMNIRDIHLFNEKLKSAYLETPGTSDKCVYETLPFVDGHEWSKKDNLAGLRLIKILQDGSKQEIICKNFSVKEIGSNQLLINWQLPSGEKFSIHFFEDRFEMSCDVSKNKNFNWALELKAADGIALPFTKVDSKSIEAIHQEFPYKIICTQGHFEKASGNENYVLRIFPESQRMVVSCDGKG